MLVNDSDSPNEPTEMEIVHIWKDTIENARTFAINIVEEFPSLVTARDLFLRIPGCPAKRSW